MLDASRQVEFVELVRDLRSRYGSTLLFVTHDLALAAAACERLVVLDTGRALEDGSGHSSIDPGLSGLSSQSRRAGELILGVSIRRIEDLVAGQLIEPTHEGDLDHVPGLDPRRITPGTATQRHGGEARQYGT